MRTVTITGSRTAGHHDAAHYAQLFTAYLAPFAADAHFYLGGGRGIDSLALRWLAEETDAWLTVAVPGTLDQQPPEARNAVNRSWERLAEIVELAADPLDDAAYLARNRWMVDRSAMVIGFPVGTSTQSGTWQTLDYASQQGKARLVVPT
ncbi:DNA-processing protein DprA [Streptomyces qinglanensis]|uniref:DNA recombination-mediator protein A n=1 Tax=Streptomyces qinglanensis TaxID=943816 RepID=A0A1H9PSI1_9ACTN|nr:DNA-processing protein DprA [Streptomyces qinglanensis]SER51187.1 DNA recombination-mediator protein A [Streptomyces qinglanensis]